MTDQHAMILLQAARNVREHYVAAQSVPGRPLTPELYAALTDLAFAVSCFDNPDASDLNAIYVVHGGEAG